jgi:putative ABC transport system permease protein
LKIQLVAGRNFQEGNSADEYRSIIVNEALVKEYGWKDPIGQKLPGRYDERIVGVVKNFNYESLHTKVEPLVLALRHDSIMRHSQDVSFAVSPQPRVSVRMKGGNPISNQEILKKAWMTVAPNQEFEFSFLDDKIAAQYEAEQRTAWDCLGWSRLRLSNARRK